MFHQDFRKCWAAACQSPPWTCCIHESEIADLSQALRSVVHRRPPLHCVVFSLLASASATVYFAAHAICKRRNN